MLENKYMILDAMSRVDKSHGCPNWVDLEDLERALNLPSGFRSWDQSVQERFKGYFLINWMCTDTWVGFEVIFLDDEMVACRIQDARKSDPTIEFTSVQAAKKVYDVLLPSFDESNVPVVKSDQTLGARYSVQFATQLLNFEGFYNDKPVKLVRERYKSAERMVTVEDEDGMHHRIPVTDFMIPINLRKE